MKRKHYVKNQIVNGLVYLALSELRDNGGHRKAFFRCYCGKEFICAITRIENNYTKSCGCLCVERIKKTNTTHGLSYTILYNIYFGMKARCYNKSNKDYNLYGYRGIKICDEWLNDFKEFYDFSINNGWREGLQIDRINNNGNYEPDNCRFVTPAENCRNRRNTKLNWNLVTEIRNVKLLIPKMPQRELAEAYNVKQPQIGRILRNERWAI